MREVPIPCGFLSFPAIIAQPIALVNRLRYFVFVFNGWCALLVIKRDTDATWRSLGNLCRERDWSRARLLYELRRGALTFRTVPPDVPIDWAHPDVERSLDVEASTVIITRGVLAAEAVGAFVLGLDRPTIGIEVLPPTDAQGPPANAPAAASAPRRGYQAARVDGALDLLVKEGLKLSDYTIPELRRLVLKKIPGRVGEALPSRQTVGRAIRRRLAKLPL
jgi:hypothetical protein